MAASADGTVVAIAASAPAPAAAAPVTKLRCVRSVMTILPDLSPGLGGASVVRSTCPGYRTCGDHPRRQHRGGLLIPREPGLPPPSTHPINPPSWPLHPMHRPKPSP